MADGRPQKAGVERIHAEPIWQHDMHTVRHVGDTHVRLVIVIGENETLAGVVAQDVAAQLILGRGGNLG